MSTTQPIKDMEQIQELKNYFWEKGEIRNYLMVIMGLNTSLRISDILGLRWKDVYNFKTHQYKEHLIITEQKTGKNSSIALNDAIIAALECYRKTSNIFMPDIYLFKSRNGENHPISRSRAFTIIKDASLKLGMEENVACHSLRKTFGYQAWKKGIPPALLMSIYNHSSYEITKRYLGISQDERDRVFLELSL